MTDMILEQLHPERNHSQSTIQTYGRSCRYYETLTGHTIQECLDIADDEEYNNIRWKNTQTRKWILQYREWLYHEYNVSTAQLYLTVILTIYRHFEITIPPLPYYSKKGLRKSAPINYSDLPDRQILSECLTIASPLVRALILFMSSSGVSRIDTLNLTIQDYLQATNDYHDHQESVKYAIRDMLDLDIIPCFHLKRQKTGMDYFTFCSHEACKSINSYLLTRTEILTRDKPLFKIHERYINMVFETMSLRSWAMAWDRWHRTDNRIDVQGAAMMQRSSLAVCSAGRMPAAPRASTVQPSRGVCSRKRTIDRAACRERI